MTDEATDDDIPEIERRSPRRGDPVEYMLTSADIVKINMRRLTSRSSRGSPLTPGQIVTMLITHVFPDGRTVSGQAFLDGNDSLWVQEAPYGERAGNWVFRG